MVGTRGSFFGSLGVATSFAGFCWTTPSRASHLYNDRTAASARATETLLSPRLCRSPRKPRIKTWSTSFHRICGPRYSAKRCSSFSYARNVCVDAFFSARRYCRNCCIPFPISRLTVLGLTSCFMCGSRPTWFRVDDICDKRSSDGPALRECKPELSTHQHVQEWFARCEDRRRFPPCGLRNCASAYAGWRGVRNATQRLPSATRAVV